MSRILLEVCVASVTDCIIAERAGADRLELNMGLELGGLTPSLNLLKKVRAAVEIPVIVMIRPRAAGFCYSDIEQQIMLADTGALLDHGADGIAAGCLNSDTSIHVEFWQQLVKLCAGKDAVFHRAFDVVFAQDAALEQLVDCGTTRILTSGGMPTVPAGAEKIRRLNELGKGRIEFLPGSGVTAENVCDMIRKTTCDQIHGSFKTMQTDPAGDVAPQNYPVTDGELVAQARTVLDALSNERLKGA